MAVSFLNMLEVLYPMRLFELLGRIPSTASGGSSCANNQWHAVKDQVNSFCRPWEALQTTTFLRTSRAAGAVTVSRGR